MFKKKELQKVSAKSPEYQNFNDLVGNRPKDTSKIKLIQDSFESIGNFLYCLPIVVSEDGRIVDGQNRLAAARACNPQQDIYVVMIPNKDVAKVAIALNTNKKNWTLANFANYWSKQTDDKKVSEIYKKYLPDIFLQKKVVTKSSKKDAYPSGRLIVTTLKTLCQSCVG